MNHKVRGGICIACAAAIGMAAGILTVREENEFRPQQVLEMHTQISRSGEPQSARYRLGGYNGKLAVFIIGKKEPEIVFDVYLHYLPDVDRQRLDEGIEVADYQQLIRLIEDYTS
ncbi:MAG: hypothetical protein RR135_00470 [Oscillospiraceae bacterium]